jgi:glucose-6-phosphate 1-dehydrogenase
MSAGARRAAPDPQEIVIFGASGDLTKRKLLPAFFHLFTEGLLPEPFVIVGYSRSEVSDQEFAEDAREAVKRFGHADPSGDAWDAFAKRLSYLPGEFASEHAMMHLRGHLERVGRTHGTGGRRFFYAATPPTAYAHIVARIAEAGLQSNARIVIEKPFGHDLQSARELNRALHEVFDETQIFRIDHYLGKETVQNILAFRFANGMFEPIWNRRYVDGVQISVAEEIGIEGRGSFYEGTGAIRDMIQTHLFQTLTFLLMEPPVSFEPDRLRDEKVKVLRAAKDVDPAKVVLGQYDGYRSEPGVAADSTVETFVAMQIEIDSWRWAGVPIFLRTGKKLERKVSEITLGFRDVPYDVFRGTGARVPGHDHLTIRVQPNEGISFALNVKEPGIGLRLSRATMDFDYDRSFTSPLLDAYELLLVEAMEGDHTLFIREEEAERAWEILTPLMANLPHVSPYSPGTWGPREAEDLIAPHRWHVSVRGNEGAPSPVG